MMSKNKLSFNITENAISDTMAIEESIRMAEEIESRNKSKIEYIRYFIYYHSMVLVICYVDLKQLSPMKILLLFSVLGTLYFYLIYFIIEKVFNYKAMLLRKKADKMIKARFNSLAGRNYEW
jgi:hypothetical protein